jgi:large subunit ribosomal protein L7/L12
MEAKTVKTEEIIEAIEQMSVLDLVELKKALEERWGVTAAAPVMAAAAAGVAAAAAAPEAEEQTEFEVVLKEVGPEKVKVIKAVRDLTSLGLRESKEVVDGAPSTVVKGVPKEEAAAAKAKLEEAGAVVEVK